MSERDDARVIELRSPEYAELRRLARIGARCEAIAAKARPPIMEHNVIWATAYNKALDDCLVARTASDAIDNDHPTNRSTT